MAIYVQFLRKTAATWTSDNTVLKAGQIGVETDTLKAKFGDGATAWNSLAYMWDATGSGVPSTRQIIAGTGLTGGGTLAADRTLAVSYGTTSGTAARGNDSRLSDDRFNPRVRVVATSNMAVASAVVSGATVDGVTLATGDRVLLTGQTTASENGVYVTAASGAASRATDSIAANACWYVAEGTTYHDTAWWVTTSNPITVGTTGLTISRAWAGPSSGTGLQKGDGSGGLTGATSGTDYAPATSGSAILKGNGSGGFASAASGTDYAPATSGSALLKGNGSGGFASAVAGTDYVSPLFIAQLTSTQTLSNSNVETTLWTPSNVAAGSLSAGVTLFRVRIGGNFDNQATSGLLNGRLKINGTTVATAPIVNASITSAQTVQPWWVDLDVYIDATGSGGSVTVQGVTICETTTGGGVNPRPIETIGTAVSLTAGCQFTWTGQWATASATNVMRTARAVIQQVA